MTLEEDALEQALEKARQYNTSANLRIRCLADSNARLLAENACLRAQVDALARECAL